MLTTFQIDFILVLLDLVESGRSDSQDLVEVVFSTVNNELFHACIIEDARDDPVRDFFGAGQDVDGLTDQCAGNVMPDGNQLRTGIVTEGMWRVSHKIWIKSMFPSHVGFWFERV